MSSSGMFDIRCHLESLQEWFCSELVLWETLYRHVTLLARKPSLELDPLTPPFVTPQDTETSGSSVGPNDQSLRPTRYPVWSS